MTRNDAHEAEVSGPRPQVRSRWVWIGLVAMIVGAVVLGVGVAVSGLVVSPVSPVSVVGLVVLVVGGAVAMRGRILNDVRRHPRLGQTITDIEQGNTHPGADPTDRVEDGEIRERAREMTERKRELLHPTAATGTAPLWPIGVGLMFLCAAWLLIATWAIDPFTPTGQNVGLRESGIAVAIGLAAAWMRRPNSAPAPVAWGISVVCGLALVLFGALTTHGSSAAAGSEIAAGVATLLGSAMAWGRVRARA